MKKIKQIHDGVSTGSTGAVTDQEITKIDLQKYGTSREFLISGYVTPGATAVGSARTVTFNYYFSDEEIDTTDVVAQCANRKTSGSAQTLANSTTAVTRCAFVSTAFRPSARWLYVSFDRTAFDASATVTLDSWLVRVPDTQVDID